MTKKLKNEELKVNRITKEEFVKELTKLINSGERVSQSKAGNTMIYSARKYFGSWKNAMEYCGVNYDDYMDKKRRKWSKEKITNEITKIYEEGHSLNSSYIDNNHKDLMMASVRYFGSWKSAIEESGFSYSDFHERENWSKEIVINKIRERFNSGKSIYFSDVNEDDNALYTIGYRLFGSWKEAVESASIEYYSDYINNSPRKKGVEFEKALKLILDSIGIEYTRYDGGSTDLRPDFNIDGNIWIDAKLSQFTVFKDKTIDKYEPHCDNLMIIFLQGDNSLDMQITEKTRIISVYKFLESYDFELKENYLKILKEIEEVA